MKSLRPGGDDGRISMGLLTEVSATVKDDPWRPVCAGRHSRERLVPILSTASRESRRVAVKAVIRAPLKKRCFRRPRRRHRPGVSVDEERSGTAVAVFSAAPLQGETKG